MKTIQGKITWPPMHPSVALPISARIMSGSPMCAFTNSVVTTECVVGDRVENKESNEHTALL